MTSTTVTEKEFETTLFKEYDRLKSEMKPNPTYIIEESGERIHKDMRKVQISKLKKAVTANLKHRSFKGTHFEKYLVEMIPKVKNKVFWMLDYSPRSMVGGIIYNGSRYHHIRIEG